MDDALSDLIGFRGERIFELCLTDFRRLSKPMFRPGFLGDKWPTIDYYVELREVRGKRTYFFVQVKTTTSALSDQSAILNVSAKKRDVDRLLRIPGPTYLVGVHEPSQRVFIQSVHLGVPVQAISRISLVNELTVFNLNRLYDEVHDFWATIQHKPTHSVFQ